MIETTSIAEQPFDRVAGDYDATFTASRLGRWLREAVWEWLEASFQPGDHVLELGCGTGEDAVWLAQGGVQVLATDASPAMLEVAQRKAEAIGVAEQLSFAQLDLLDIGYWVLDIKAPSQHATPNTQYLIPNTQYPIPNIQYPISNFDGAYSNFGALNCVPDRRPIAEVLAQWVRPGGRVVLVVMGPLCPWEVVWHLAHGEAWTAFRRFRSGIEAHAGENATVRVWYPSPRRLRAEFAPHFRHLETAGIGALLPPSYLSHLVDRWPRLFERLAMLDRRLGRVFPWTWLNDHYLSVFERVP
ncbi:MAG: class I SAM-dependent methyltransferase [Anaerolineae bacterium]